MTAEDEVRGMLAEQAAADVDALLDDVRREAVDLVRRRLVQVYSDALLAAVVRRPVPSGQQPTTGCYVYAVTGGTGASAAAGETGIEPGGPVDIVSAGDVAAIVSDVDVDAVRRGCDEADVSDDGWLATAVRAHDRVVAAAFRSAPTVPMRFGIVYPDRDAVECMLRDHRRELRSELDRLTGRAEWNVKVLVDLVDTSTDPATTSVRTAGTGVEFLTRERDRRAARARVELRARAVVSEAVEALDTIATDRINIRQSAPTSGGTPFFAATYLVDRADEPTFRAAVERVREMADDAVVLTLDGPWPPFHFTSLRLEPENG